MKEIKTNASLGLSSMAAGKSLPRREAKSTKLVFSSCRSPCDFSEFHDQSALNQEHLSLLKLKLTVPSDSKVLTCNLLVSFYNEIWQ
jgi:hypothetical protein